MTSLVTYCVVGMLLNAPIDLNKLQQLEDFCIVVTELHDPNVEISHISDLIKEAAAENPETQEQFFDLLW